MKKLGILWVAALLYCIAACSAVAVPVVKTITEMPEIDGKPGRPRISGDWITAIRKSVDSKTCYGLVIYNVPQKTVYTVYEGNVQLWPAINGDLVAWCGRIDDVPSLRGTCGNRGALSSSLLLLSLNKKQYYAPQLSTTSANYVTVNGDLVAYELGSRVYLLNLRTNSQMRISSNEPLATSAEIGGDWVVWTEYNNAVDKKRQVRAYQISTGKQTDITNDGIDSCGAVTDGRTVVWWHDKVVETYDLKTGRRSTIADGFFPDVDNGIVVYLKSNKTGGNNTVYATDLATGQEVKVSVAPVVDQGPTIDGNRIIWCGGTTLYCAEIDRNGVPVEKPMVAPH